MSMVNRWLLSSSVQLSLHCHASCLQVPGSNSSNRELQARHGPVTARSGLIYYIVRVELRGFGLLQVHPRHLRICQRPAQCHLWTPCLLSLAGRGLQD